MDTLIGLMLFGLVLLVALWLANIAIGLFFGLIAVVVGSLGWVFDKLRGR